MTVTWLFDVDGTLIDGITGGSLRPGARPLLEALRARGVRVVLWSSGGADYAWRKARDNGFDDLVDETYSKVRADPDGLWDLPEEFVLAPPAVLVDDMSHEVPPVGEVVTVRQYLGPNPYDTGLAALVERALAA
ncbi:HAD family hydrolase [Pseudonocardia sp. NPDC049154]|uniref:HAD family hydrolase n=1 Tax=Pseudonocardia sp. NPDC049154 TaxID=3155501 RepID=UPI0033FD1F73